MPEGYEPDSTGDTLPHRVLAFLAAVTTGLDQRPPSWLETQLGADFERLLAERTRANPDFAHVSFDDPWEGGDNGALPGNLGQ